MGLLGVLAALILSAGWGFLLNDYFDRKVDAREGRADRGHGHGLSRRAMWAVMLLLALAAWALVFLVPGGAVFKGVLAVNYLVAALYSAPPARLKPRRFWGFLANSLIERPLPVLVLLSYMDYYTALTLALPVLMELTWSVFKHQAADVNDDIAAGVTTFAVALGPERSFRIVNSVLNPLSVVCLGSLVGLAYLAIPSLRLLLGAGFLGLVLAVAAGVYMGRRGHLRSLATPTDPPYVISLNLTYRFLVLPILGYGVLGLGPGYYPLVVLLAASLAYQAYSSYSIGRRLVEGRPPSGRGASEEHPDSAAGLQRHPHAVARSERDPGS